MTVIERVARAIHEAERAWASSPGASWEDCREVTREMRRECARAAMVATDEGAVSIDDAVAAGMNVYGRMLDLDDAHIEDAVRTGMRAAVEHARGQ